MSAAIQALILAREALRRFDCGCGLVCADDACHAAGHTHETVDAGTWACGHNCSCAPACYGNVPRLCATARQAREALAAIESAVNAPPAEEPIIRWSLPCAGSYIAGISRSGVVYGVTPGNDAGTCYFWWAEEPRSRRRFVSTKEAATRAAEEHARNQPPQE